MENIPSCASIDTTILQVNSPEAIEHISRLYKKAEKSRIPLWAHLDLTYKCNEDCIHCYCQHLSPSFITPDKKELSTEEVFRLLDELADCGSLYLTLSGGEALLRPDFFDIAFYASRQRQFAISLFSNGTLIDEKMADRLYELSPRAVEISVYGSCAEVHDSVTRRPGSFEKTMRAISLLRKRRINVVMKTSIIKKNFHQAEDIVFLCRQLGVEAYRSTVEISPRNDGNCIVQENQLCEKDIIDYFSGDFPLPWEYQPEKSLEDALKKELCGAATMGCYISPFGEVYPCIQLMISMGNVRSKPFRQIWDSPSDLRRLLEKFAVYGDLEDCRSCSFVQFCRRCHGLAYLEKGDISRCHALALVIARASAKANELAKIEVLT